MTLEVRAKTKKNFLLNLKLITLRTYYSLATFFQTIDYFHHIICRMLSLVTVSSLFVDFLPFKSLCNTLSNIRYLIISHNMIHNFLFQGRPYCAQHGRGISKEKERRGETSLYRNYSEYIFIMKVLRFKLAFACCLKY